MKLRKPPEPGKRGPYQPKDEDFLLGPWCRELDRDGLKKEAIRWEVKRRLYVAGKALKLGDTTRMIGGLTAFEIGLIITRKSMEAETLDPELGISVEDPELEVRVPDLREASKKLINLAWYLGGNPSDPKRGLRRQSWYDRLDKYLGK
jgi:hypothetical protein